MFLRISLSFLIVTYLRTSIFAEGLSWQLANDVAHSYGSNLVASITSDEVLAFRPDLLPFGRDGHLFIMFYTIQKVENEYQVLFTIGLTYTTTVLIEFQMYGVARSADNVNFELIHCGQNIQSGDSITDAIAYLGLANSWNHDCSSISTAVNTVFENNQFTATPTCSVFEINNNVAYMIVEDTVFLGDNSSTTYYVAAADISRAKNPRFLALVNATSFQNAKNICYNRFQYGPKMSEYTSSDSPNGKCIRRKVSSSSLVESCSYLQRSSYPLLQGANFTFVQYKKQQIKSCDHILGIYSVTSPTTTDSFLFVDIKINTASNSSSSSYPIIGCGVMGSQDSASNQLDTYFSMANSWSSDCSNLDEDADATARAAHTSDNLICIELQTTKSPGFLIIYQYTDDTGTHFFGAGVNSRKYYPNSDEDSSDSSSQAEILYSTTITYTGDVLTKVENMLYTSAWND